MSERIKMARDEFWRRNNKWYWLSFIAIFLLVGSIGAVAFPDEWFQVLLKNTEVQVLPYVAIYAPTIVLVVIHGILWAKARDKFVAMQETDGT